MKLHRWKVAGTAAAFFVLTCLTIASTRFSGGLALIWTGSGIAAALLLTMPRSRWVYLLGLFGTLSAIATAFFGFGPVVALPLAVVNMAEAWVLSSLLLLLRPQRDWLESIAGLQRMVVSIAVGTLLIAIPGGLIAAWAISTVWLDQAIDWAIGHTLGSLLTFPLAWLALSARRSRKFHFRLTKEDYRLIGHLTLIGGVTGFSLVGSAVSLLFLPIVPLMYAAFRCGLRGALFGFVLILILSIASLNFSGSYLNNLNFSPANEAKFLQLYFAILLLLALPVSIAIKQYNSIVAELREKRALEGLVADYSNDALINLGPNGEVRFCSPAGSLLSGLEEPEGKSFTEFFDPLDEHVVDAALKDAAENPGDTVPLELSITVDDEARWLEAKLRAVATEASDQIIGFAVTIRDITRRKQIELDATRMAETDPLTGLANRRAFFSKFEQRLDTASARPFALAIIDLDHFKDINDRYGHTTGDAVLKLVGKLMRRFSQPGIFIARIGGEEFALLAEKVDPNEALNLCENLRKEIASLMPVAHTGENISLTTSIGIAMIEERLDPSEAMRSADGWLYKAKRSGRNQTKMAA